MLIKLSSGDCFSLGESPLICCVRGYFKGQVHLDVINPTGGQIRVNIERAVEKLLDTGPPIREDSQK